MDSDISIANASILLEDFVLRFPADARIAFTDGSENFNAGAFFIKNDPWSYWLLQAWCGSLGHGCCIAPCTRMGPPIWIWIWTWRNVQIKAPDISWHEEQPPCRNKRAHKCMLQSSP